MPEVAQRWSNVERATAPRFVVLLHLLHLLHPPIGVAGGGGATNPPSEAGRKRAARVLPAVRKNLGRCRALLAPIDSPPATPCGRDLCFCIRSSQCRNVNLCKDKFQHMSRNLPSGYHKANKHCCC